MFLKRPILLFFLEPMVFNLCLYAAILLGTLYLFFGAFPLVFATNYGFNLWQGGLTFFGIIVGILIGAAMDPLWRRNYRRLVRIREGETGEEGGSEPEFRLPQAIFGAVLVPMGIFWFAWTCYPDIHWIVPVIGSVFFGMGSVSHLLSPSAYLIFGG
jgi:hypothetical protein